MAEGVVDLLEAVEVDEHEREAASRRVRIRVLGDDRVEQLEQRAAVPEAGQLVGDRLASALLGQRAQADQRQRRARAGDDERGHGQTERHAADVVERADEQDQERRGGGERGEHEAGRLLGERRAGRRAI